MGTRVVLVKVRTWTVYIWDTDTAKWKMKLKEENIEETRLVRRLFKEYR